ncbi:hypothetical protein C8R43DRAFT_1050590 [Mycena crocata]|nr:hypothetical protein C8R43DRAFT_1050590 [Mycena crocata]
MSTGPDSDSPVLSAKFNSPDADVTFKSSDGVLFRIHRKNLEVCTEGFPPPEISASSERGRRPDRDCRDARAALSVHLPTAAPRAGYHPVRSPRAACRGCGEVPGLSGDEYLPYPAQRHGARAPRRRRDIRGETRLSVSGTRK